VKEIAGVREILGVKRYAEVQRSRRGRGEKILNAKVSKDPKRLTE
jgi:hypothetical protein